MQVHLSDWLIMKKEKNLSLFGLCLKYILSIDILPLFD
uniref:NADH-plastoquinone oxidoreductase subunit J n=1 Tax=Corybas taliensis TaxID=2681627 RepID=A0A6B9UNZ1_CORTA|nr:NADH-plastoquinone oxidoreductase subunit J [Corybas taliensis]QHN69931.1 NADH-plastoquinone oxidoreductase subunit J [Corybas taliensis]